MVRQESWFCREEPYQVVGDIRHACADFVGFMPAILRECPRCYCCVSLRFTSCIWWPSRINHGHKLPNGWSNIPAARRFRTIPFSFVLACFSFLHIVNIIFTSIIFLGWYLRDVARAISWCFTTQAPPRPDKPRKICVMYQFWCRPRGFPYAASISFGEEPDTDLHKPTMHQLSPGFIGNTVFLTKLIQH